MGGVILFFTDIFLTGFGMLIFGMAALSLFKERRVLPLSLKIGILILIPVVIVVVTSAYSYFMGFNKLFSFTLNICLAISICLVLCKTKLYMALLFGTSMMLLLEAIGLLAVIATQIIITKFINLSQDSNLSLINVFLSIAINIITLLLFIVIVWFKNRISEKAQLKMAGGFSVFMVLIFFIVIYGSIEVAGGADMHSFIIGYSVIFIVFVGLLVFALTQNFLRQKYMAQQLENTVELLSAQKNHIEQMAQKQAQIQQISHDFKQHVHTLLGLCDSGNPDDVAEALKKLSQQPLSGINMISTGNAMLDALLSIKREIMERENITCDWQIKIPPKLPINELETCAVLGNALDNAIEACQKSTASQLLIKVDMYCKNDWLLCEISNPVTQMPKADGGIFQTSKSDTEYHGLGLQSMTRCCENMGGDLDIYFDKEKFTVRFMLPLSVACP